ncbi:MAG: RNA methyltransferase [Ginsengibacter sp.]
MLSKSILKYIQSLHQKKFRDEHSVFIAEGPKVITELLSSGRFICKMICALDDFINENEELLLPVEQKNKLAITEIELEKISLLHTPNKVVGIFYKKQADEFVLQQKLNLMLDDIQDPGNMGTIIRIADWFNIKNIICSENCVEMYNPKVVQASMGSIARVNVFYKKLEEFIIENKEIDVYAASLNGKSLYSLNNITTGLILIGNESKGINREVLNLVTDQIIIPRYGGAESLNAAVATGIILSHLVYTGTA